jgi:uncharacterized circularly permuted ATP-grasp superfamily protein
MKNRIPTDPHPFQRSAYNEWYAKQEETPVYHSHVQPFSTLLDQTDWSTLATQSEAQFRQQGITFSLGNHPEHSVERSIPFDPIPRVIAASEWKRLERGLIQRVKALNAFLADMYSNQFGLHAGIFPKTLLEHPQFYSALKGCIPSHRALANVSGIDLVRDKQGQFFVLEDNVRVPSGVAYMLKNREVLQTALADEWAAQRIAPIHSYPQWLLETLSSLMPQEESPTVVVLTPGLYNSAYYEHVLLAERMGVPLVEGRDLTVYNDRVFWRSARGLLPVHVIYRRVDDAFLDPECFRPDSLLGVPGLIRAYKKGHVAIANAPGTGIADDKLMYCFVPDMIRFYLDEIPILQNIPTRSLAEPDIQQQLKSDPTPWVIKRVDGSGGYDMLIASTATEKEAIDFIERALQNATQYVVQPVLALSTCPTWDDASASMVNRHVDLRPYVLAGETVRVVPGGLTRVALTPGSLVVNSSQGGGTKDTWIVHTEEDAYTPTSASSMTQEDQAIDTLSESFSQIPMNWTQPASPEKRIPL